MRDDIASQFEDIVKLLKEKHFHLTKLYLSNCEKRNLLKIGDVDAILECIHADEFTIQKINCIDAQIAEIKKAICEKCGIKENEFEKHFALLSQEIIQTYKHFQKEITKIFNAINKENTAFTQDLKRELQITQKDINDLNRIKKIFEKFQLL